MAHPLRRRRLSSPAARLDVAMNDTVVAIVSAFFVIGILVGIIAVVAMSVLRAERRGYPEDPLDYEPPNRGGQPTRQITIPAVSEKSKRPMRQAYSLIRIRLASHEPTRNGRMITAKATTNPNHDSWYHGTA